MDLSNFVTYDKKESLLLSIQKYTLDELVDKNRIMKQKLSDSDYEFEFNIEADTISKKSVLTTHDNYFNSESNKLLGSTNEYYIRGTHKSEKPVMITTTDKVHLKCDCVDGSIVIGIREQILFRFNLSAPPGYKIIKSQYYFV